VGFYREEKKAAKALDGRMICKVRGGRGRGFKTIVLERGGKEVRKRNTDTRRKIKGFADETLS